MRAAVLHEFKRPRSIEEVERPKPNQNEVLIAVEACGVCHSDLHVATLHLDIRRLYTNRRWQFSARDQTRSPPRRIRRRNWDGLTVRH